MNAFGRRVVEAFADRSVPVVAVDTDDGKLRERTPGAGDAARPDR